MIPVITGKEKDSQCLRGWFCCVSLICELAGSPVESNVIFQEMPVALRCFVRKNFMDKLSNIKAQLEGHTHFFKAKNLKEKLSMELY